MCYELDFWKYQIDAIPDHQAVYGNLCDDEEIEGLVALPIGAMLERIAVLFADWDKLDARNYESVGRGRFQIANSPFWLRVDSYQMSGEDMNLFIEMGTEFGCPLYDPQTGVRFDGAS